MSTEPDYHEQMKLPPGKTCADCVHVQRCEAFGFTRATNTKCDFWPSCFRERTSHPKPTGTAGSDGGGGSR